jgi:hypothetical protein
MAQKTREQILELVMPLLTNAASPSREIAITGGSLATLLGLDWGDLFKGGKSAAQLEAERLAAENEELRAKLAAATAAPAAESKPAVEPTAPAPVVAETAPVEKPLPGENATVDPPADDVIDEIG